MSFITDFNVQKLSVDNLKDGIKDKVRDYNNLYDVTSKLEIEQTKKELELSKLNGDEARVKRLEIEQLKRKIASNKTELSQKESVIKEHQKIISDFNKPKDDKTNIPFATNTEELPANLPGIPDDPDTATFKKNLEENKLKNISANTGTIDTADTAGFSQEDAESAQEITEIRSNNSLYSGLKSNDDDTITNERVKYFNSDNKTEGFILPWDGRLSYAYSSSQSIGNHMPYGDEWVGSPAIMNPYALIRFDHVAGSRHHKFLIDQKNNKGGFRSTLYKPYANVKDYGSSITIGTNDAKERIATFNDLKAKQELGITEADGTTYVDESGSLYVNEVDYSQEIWRPQKEVTVVKTGRTYSKNDDPAEVTVDTPLAGQNAELARANAIMAMRSNYETTKNIKANYKTIDKKSLDEENKNKITPDNPAFWVLKQGWKKCKKPDGKMLYVEPQHCEGDTIKSGASAEVIAQIEKDAESARSYIELQISRGWIKIGNNTKKRYLRKPNSKPTIKEPVEPTTDNLTNPENFTGTEQFQYRWADFLYCTYYDLIPNNLLVTLRRYPMPVGDNATMIGQDKTKQHLLPVASAITWMGAQTGNQVSELMTFSYHMNWRDLKAEINEIQGNEQGAADSPFGEGIGKWLGILSGQSNFNSVSGWDEQRAKFDPYKDGSYANRIYGPVNVIDSTKARDRGLAYDHQINLNFHYSLKSIGGINPKAAMLDIMANILALTYNNAGFWGGANRYFPNKPAYPFPGGKKSQDAWYSGNATGMLDGIADQLSTALGNIGSFVQNLITNPREALKGLAGKGTQLWMAEKQRDKRPAILGLKALLTGDPVGEWHLVIGNPFNPIMMIGNLICTNTKISFSDRLGADDFPDQMTVSITLDHGLSRDKGSVESMFNRGNGRLHYSYYGQNTEFWNNASSTRDSKIDCANCKQTVDDNFTGKKRVMSADTNSDYGGSARGGAVKDAWTMPQSALLQGKMYSSNKQAQALAEKIGFKSGGE